MNRDLEKILQKKDSLLFDDGGAEPLFGDPGGRAVRFHLVKSLVELLS